MAYISRPTIALAHRDVIEYILDEGVELITEDSEYTLELPSPLAVHIDMPLEAPNYLPEIGFSMNYLVEYSHQMMQDNTQGFEYTYGGRFINYNGVNQFQETANKINVNANTRRAIMHTWMVDKDINAHHVPCMQTLQFMKRDGFLNAIATFRSNDMLMAWGCNVFGLSRILACMAVSTHSQPGYIETYSTSAHIYVKRDENVLRALQYEC